jgi:hypothetical protein
MFAGVVNTSVDITTLGALAVLAAICVSAVVTLVGICHLVQPEVVVVYFTHENPPEVIPRICRRCETFFAAAFEGYHLRPSFRPQL